MKYYSLEPALSRGATMMLTIGKRGSGKTYSFKKYAYSDYIKKGLQWVYVRRGEDEINSIKQGFWDDFLINEDIKKEIKVKGHTCYIRDAMPIELEGKEKREWQFNNEWKVFGYFIPLSKSQNFKSASFPLVNKICYDEFIIENTRRHYLPDEVNQFLGLVSTIARNRKVKVFCLSNAGFVSNPFFTEYGVNSADFNNSQWVRRNNGEVLFEYNNDNSNDDILMKSAASVIAGEEYIAYAVENKFKDGNSDLCSPKPHAAAPYFKITKNGKKWLTIYKSPEGGNWWIDLKDSNVHGYSLSRWTPVEDAMFNNEIAMILKNKLDKRSLNFSSPDVREMFLTWIKRD